MTEKVKLLGKHRSSVNEGSERHESDGNNQHTPNTPENPKSEKKKYIIGGIIGLLVIAALVLVIVLLKKGDEPDPDEPIVYYDPYEVEAADESGTVFTLKRNTKLLFDYPFQESLNNKFIDTVELTGKP